MKGGQITTYISEDNASILSSHCPISLGGRRTLAAKLGYILPAWDRVLRGGAQQIIKRYGGDFPNLVERNCEHNFGRSFESDMQALVQAAPCAELRKYKLEIWSASHLASLAWLVSRVQHEAKKKHPCRVL